MEHSMMLALTSALNVLVLFVALYAVIIYKQLTKELKVFTWFIFFSAIIQHAGLILWLQSRNSLPLLHLYVAGGFLLLSLFYIKVWDGKGTTKIILVTTILFLMFTLLNSLFVQNIFTFNSYALTIESFLLVIYSLSTFARMGRQGMSSPANLAKSIIWINSGLFLFYLSNLLIYYFRVSLKTLF